MTWLGQKQDPEPTVPNRPTTAFSPQVAPAATHGARSETMETSKVASIGKSLHVKGELTGNEDLVIEGTVEGKITLSGFSVTIGQTGRVAAEIHAKSVVVGGQVKGNINADERFEVAATGSMVGDVRSPRVVLADGAKFKGSVDMDTKPASAASVSAPVVSRATSAPSIVPSEPPVYAGAGKS